MEILEWALQLKSLARLNDIQLSNVNLSALILGLYLFCLMVKIDASRGNSLLAFFICLIISYSPLYDILNEMQYHGLFSAIYLRLVFEVKPITAKTGVLSIGLFQLAMAIDGNLNADVETFIYKNYEVAITLLHCFVIGSFIKSEVLRIKSAVERFINSCFDFVRYTSNYAYLW